MCQYVISAIIYCFLRHTPYIKHTFLFSVAQYAMLYGGNDILTPVRSLLYNCCVK